MENPIGQRGTLPAVSVPVEEMPDYVIKSVLATEDRRFFDHWGIDLQGLTRAILQNLQAKSVVQGGSTLTQQLAKNLFLTNERTITRKIKEAYLALWLEANFSKKRFYNFILTEPIWVETILAWQLLQNFILAKTYAISPLVNPLC